MSSINRDIPKELIIARPSVLNHVLCINQIQVDDGYYYTLTDNNGYIFNESEVNEMLKHLKPFYSLPNSDEIAKKNNDEFLKQFLGIDR